ncbi:MAG: 30S ribosomal protein S20 [candidate division NC10 bacterium]|nr:30S ribosomal protein S20 [candidate division NC10 bacterium]MDE2322160.1 30S ribosomal protein S20 [candidate division NC10 bacterium]
MPITKSAQKQMRQSQKRRLRNRAAKSNLKTVIKKVRAGIEGHDRDAAEKAFMQAVPSIDRAAGKGFIHKNAAARYKSRLARQLHAIPQPS